MFDSLRRSPYRLTYFRAEQAAAMPSLATSAFPEPDEMDRRLSVDFAGVIANCHFFTQEEIEFDIDPREVKGQSELDALFGFMHLLADSVGKQCVLTPEDFRETVILRVVPGSSAVEWRGER
jgi:hypothetical protein